MYELFDFNNNKVSFDQLDNKAFWCEHGERQERAFISVFNKLKSDGLLKKNYVVDIHPEKETNPYHPDLIIDKEFLGDAKIKNSPLFMAKAYSVPPQFALTIDLKDIFNYRKRFLNLGQDILIFVWVKWEAHKMITPHSTYSVNQMGGIWVTKISKVLSFLKDQKVGIHWYKESFRRPDLYELDHAWAKELLDFEKRLSVDGKVKNISSKGFIVSGSNHITYPSGHSSCSYVFNLDNSELFENLFLRLKRK